MRVQIWLLAVMVVQLSASCSGGSPPAAPAEGAPEILLVSPGGGATGSQIQFKATVSGASPITYRWDFSGACLPGSSKDAGPLVQLADIGTYECSLTVSNSAGSDKYDFDVFVNGYSSRGRVMSLGSRGMDGVTINLSNTDKTAVTDDSGYWHIDDLMPGSYVVTPTHSDWSFDPPRLDLEISSTDVADLNFVFSGPQNTEQNWVHTWSSEPANNEEAEGIAADPTGALVFVGGGAATVVRYNSRGDLAWSRSWTPTDAEAWLRSVAIDPAGNIYVSGNMNNDDGNNACLIKLDPDGKLIWQQRFENGSNNVWVSALHAGLDGNIYLCGGATEEPNKFSDGLVAAVSADGELLWCRTWGGVDGESIADLSSDSEGISVVGTTESFGSIERAALVLRFSPAGELVWARSWETDDTSDARSVVCASGRTYVAVAATTSYVDSNTEEDVLLAYGADGETLWSKSVLHGSGAYNSDDSPAQYPSLLAMPDGSIMLADGVSDYEYGGDIALVRMDAEGNFLWRLSFSGPENHGSPKIAADPSGAIFVGGAGPNISGFWVQSDLSTYKHNGVETSVPGQAKALELSFVEVGGKMENIEGVADTGAPNRSSVFAAKLTRAD